MLYDGQPVAAALAFSHEEQVARLRATAPAAEPVAEIVGDPCYDRILASLEHRSRYRDALGTGSRTLVYVSSTWFRNALLGSWPDLLHRLVAELPVDIYQVAVALHPNIWHGHGPWQVRSWLAECVRAGMVLLPEIDGWRTGLVAADVVIGDHGSVTGYGAALGHPTLLATFADEDIDPAAPIADLAAFAPRLDRERPLRPQIETALREHSARRFERLSASVTSVPGEALVRLRALFYRILDLDPPPGSPPVSALPVFAPSEVPHRALRVAAAIDRDARLVALTRRPPTHSVDPASGDDLAPHLLCSIDHPQATTRAEAAILTASAGDALQDDWARATLRRYPGAIMSAVLGPDEATAEFRDGSVWQLSAPGAPADALPSALGAWFLAGLPSADLTPAFTLRLGDVIYEVTIRHRRPARITSP